MVEKICIIFCIIILLSACNANKKIETSKDNLIDIEEISTTNSPVNYTIGRNSNMQMVNIENGECKIFDDRVN